MSKISQTIVNLYTDGSSLGNPGPGGYGAILVCNNIEKELSAGFLFTTNNRMELLGVIIGLEALKKPTEINIYTDSKYIHDAITAGWLEKWQKNGWKSAAKKNVKNQDLWQRLIPLLKINMIHMIWVKGHSGHIFNERCDILAKNAAQQPNLPEDIGFINAK